MTLSCVDEVLQVIGGAFKSAFKDPAVGPRLAESRLLLRLGLIDPDCVLVVDAERGEVRLAGLRDSGPRALLAMDAETANRCCQGQVNLAEALERGEIAAEGDVAYLFELVADRDAFPRLYAEVLRREHREDLLVA